MKCPYCQKKACVPDVCYLNVENYGSNSFNVPCLYCKQMLNVGLKREVKLVFVNASKEKYSDIGGHEL